MAVRRPAVMDARFDLNFSLTAKPKRKVIASDESGSCRIRVIDPDQILTASDLQEGRSVDSASAKAIQLAKAVEVVGTAVEVLQRFSNRPKVSADMLSGMVLAVADYVLISERLQPAPTDTYKSGLVRTLSASCDVELCIYRDEDTGEAGWQVSASEHIPDPTFPLDWAWLARNLEGLRVSIYDIDALVDALTSEGSKASLDMARQLRPFREDRWKWASLVTKNLTPVVN